MGEENMKQIQKSQSIPLPETVSTLHCPELLIRKTKALIKKES